MMGERRIIPVTPNKRRAPALYELIGNKDRDGVQPGAPATPPAPVHTAPVKAPSAPETTKRPPAAEVARATPGPAPLPARTSGVASSAPTRVLEADTDEDRPGTRVLGITPGSRLNIPVGFAFIAAAVVLAAVLGAYMLGYDKREKEARRELERLAARESGEIVDPTRLPIRGFERDATLRQTPQVGSGTQPAQRPGATAARPGPVPAASNLSATNEPGKVGSGGARLHVVKSPKDDPRVPGLNYPTVATLPVREATAAAEFLVSRGYSTAVVPSTSDSRLFMVIPLIGVERSNYQKGSEEAGRVLRDLGRAFKRDHKGATDFNDLFWKKFDR